MQSNGRILHGTNENDPEWIVELSFYCYIINTRDLSDENKKSLVELFLEYKRDGLRPKEALQKAEKVIKNSN